MQKIAASDVHRGGHQAGQQCEANAGQANHAGFQQLPRDAGQDMHHQCPSWLQHDVWHDQALSGRTHQSQSRGEQGVLVVKAVVEQGVLVSKAVV